MKKPVVMSVAALLLVGCEATLPGKTLQLGNFICSESDTKIKIDPSVLKSQDFLPAPAGTPAPDPKPVDFKEAVNACIKFLQGEPF